jgi:hypothetical protein
MVIACLPLLLLAVLIHQYGVRAGRIERQSRASGGSD